MFYEWISSFSPVAYPEALHRMACRVEEILEGKASDLVWCLEHPSLYTAGTSAKPHDLLKPDKFPVYETGRGGQYTYHGPGQRVIYLMMDLNKQDKDIRQFIYRLEEWIIQTLSTFKIVGERRVGRVGIWVTSKGEDKKIAAIGVRLKRWVSYHGVAVNINPILDHFSGIIPCGLPDFGVTSLEALGIKTYPEEIDYLLRKNLPILYRMP